MEGPICRFVDNKPLALTETHADPDIAKELVNSLINLGTVGGWRQRYNIVKDPPKWVWDMQVLLELAAKADATENPTLASKCEKLSTVTYWLNCVEERKNLDDLEAHH